MRALHARAGDGTTPVAETVSEGATPKVSGTRSLAVAVPCALVVGLVILGVLAMGGAEAVVLAVLALLSIVGLFALFGLLAGYVRVDHNATAAMLQRSVSDDADTAMEVATADGAVLYANRKAQSLRGGAASLEQLVSKDPRSADALYRLARAADRCEARTEDILLTSTPDRVGDAATPTWLRITVRPYMAPVTVPEQRRLVIWQASDITLDRAREADAIGQLERALGYFDAMPVGVAAVAPDGRIVHMNGTVQRMLALSQHSLRASSLSLGDVLASDSALLVMHALTQSPDHPVTFDLDAVREDGVAVPVQVLVRANPQGLRSSLRTLMITERTTLRTTPLAGAMSQPASDDRFSRLFHAAPFGIVTVARDGQVVTSNAAFGRLFPETHGRQTNVAKLIGAGAAADQCKALETALERALAGRAGGAPIEISSGADGQIARRVYVHPLTVGADPREAAVVFIADATEQKALELKFAQSQKMDAVGKLAGGIAHDFNNVLTVIIGMSDLLLQARRPTDPGYNDIMQIRSNANRAAGMVGQLLAFSRKQTLTPEVLAVNDLVQDYAFSLAKLVGEKIDFKHQPGRDLWSVKADKSQFMQVVFNLAANARDAMADGGKLLVRTKNVSERESLKFGGHGMPAGEYVEIAVEDTGTGMSPEVMAKIFEPFFTTKDVGKGTGLGLSTVYGIVKQTGGFIYPESRIGKGTTFRVFLPRHIPDVNDEAEAAASQAKKKEPSRDLTGTGRVLLVEDEDGVRSFAVRALQRQGYEVLEAASGVEALEVLEAAGGKVDIVVSDVIMPEMDGPTMYKEMLKTKPELKIIFVSGYPSDAFEKSLDPDTAFAFLPKPFTLPQLAAKVKEELGR